MSEPVNIRQVVEAIRKVPMDGEWPFIVGDIVRNYRDKCVKDARLSALPAGQSGIACAVCNGTGRQLAHFETDRFYDEPPASDARGEGEKHGE